MKALNQTWLDGFLADEFPALDPTVHRTTRGWNVHYGNEIVGFWTGVQVGNHIEYGNTLFDTELYDELCSLHNIATGASSPEIKDDHKCFRDLLADLFPNLKLRVWRNNDTVKVRYSHKEHPSKDRQEEFHISTVTKFSDYKKSKIDLNEHLSDGGRLSPLRKENDQPVILGEIDEWLNLSQATF